MQPMHCPLIFSLNPHLKAHFTDEATEAQRSKIAYPNICWDWSHQPRCAPHGGSRPTPQGASVTPLPLNLCTENMCVAPLFSHAVSTHEVEPQYQDVGPSACSICCHMPSVQHGDGVEEMSGKKLCLVFQVH